MTPDELAREAALHHKERFLSSIVDEWLSTCSGLMALYESGLNWDEVLALAVEEITEARRRGEP